MAKRQMDLCIEDEEQLEDIAQALNATVRRKILSMLRFSSYSIAELAKQLDLPISTVSFHVNILRKAGFVSVTVKKYSRGNVKLISRQIDSVTIDFRNNLSLDRNSHQQVFNIPLGSFSDAHVEAGCGMASENSIIIADDTPGVFFSPERLNAQLIWFTKGYLEYRIPNYLLKNRNVSAITFSMEICSEAPNYRNEWPSDITFWVNGVELCTYLSPGDYGGRRGRLNPSWYSDYSSQYGIVKTLKITKECVYLDETVVGYQTLSKLNVTEGDFLTLRIGVKPDAKNQGGVNLFGEKFGDVPQGLMYMVDYSS